MPAHSWRGLRTGDQIGNLEYVVDETALARYRQLVGAGGCFPNLMAEDCRAMLYKHEPVEPLTTVWQRLDFLRPPILGRRLQVGGWVREVDSKCGRAWIRAAAFAVDDIGTEILRSEAAFVVGRDAARSGPGVERTRAKTEVVTLTGSRAGDGGHLGQLRIPNHEQLRGFFDIASEMAGRDIRVDGCGLTPVMAGWLEGIMGTGFGDDFRWGGTLSIVYHRAVNPGMELHCDGVVLGHDTDTNGVETRRLAITVRGAGGYRVATTEAVVKSPSPLLM